MLRPIHAFCISLAGLVVLGGCENGAKRINLTTYSPVVDVKVHGRSQQTFDDDLDDCRLLGLKAQAAYDEQQRKERAEAAGAAIFGVVVGAALGSAIGQANDDYHSGRTTTYGALTGLHVGAEYGAQGLDYVQTIAKFGPTAIVDRCISARGWSILSGEGFGGG